MEATNSARFSDRIGRHETVRRWVNHFGSAIATDLRKRRPKPHSTWHLDEVYIKVDGRLVYLWRAVHAEGEVLDVLVQSKRDKRAALKLMRKLLNKMNIVPDKLVTDDLQSYGAACRDLESPTAMNEGGGITTERRTRINQPDDGAQDAGIQECRSAQRSLSFHAATYNTFNVQRHLTSASTHRVFRASAMRTWREVTAAA